MTRHVAAVVASVALSVLWLVLPELWPPSLLALSAWWGGELVAEDLWCTWAAASGSDAAAGEGVA